VIWLGEKELHRAVIIIIFSESSPGV
jgi:hypothetical protein